VIRLRPFHAEVGECGSLGVGQFVASTHALPAPSAAASSAVHQCARSRPVWAGPDQRPAVCGNHVQSTPSYGRAARCSVASLPHRVFVLETSFTSAGSLSPLRSRHRVAAPLEYYPGRAPSGRRRPGPVGHRPGRSGAEPPLLRRRPVCCPAAAVYDSLTGPAGHLLPCCGREPGPGCPPCCCQAPAAMAAGHSVVGLVGQHSRRAAGIRLAACPAPRRRAPPGSGPSPRSGVLCGLLAGR
jgi:hypothetical protein